MRDEGQKVIILPYYHSRQYIELSESSSPSHKPDDQLRGLKADGTISLASYRSKISQGTRLLSHSAFLIEKNDSAIEVG